MFMLHFPNSARGWNRFCRVVYVGIIKSYEFISDTYLVVKLIKQLSDIINRVYRRSRFRGAHAAVFIH